MHKLHSIDKGFDRQGFQTLLALGYFCSKDCQVLILSSLISFLTYNQQNS